MGAHKLFKDIIKIALSAMIISPLIAHAQFFNDPGAGASIINYTSGGVGSTVITGSSPVAIKAMSYMAASYVAPPSAYIPNFKLTYFIYDNGPDNGNYTVTGDPSGGGQLIWKSAPQDFTSSNNSDFAWRRSTDFLPITLLANRKYIVGAFTESGKFVNFRSLMGTFSAGGFTSRQPIRFLQEDPLTVTGLLPTGRLQLQFFQATADLSITKTNNVTSVSPGSTVTYNITASNAGPDGAKAIVSDIQPTSLTDIAWTCVGANSGTCSSSGSGNINDAVALPSGGSVTYTVTGTISASATGTISNTATVSSQAGLVDPDLSNNTATDTDNVVPPQIAPVINDASYTTPAKTPISGNAGTGGQVPAGSAFQTVTPPAHGQLTIDPTTGEFTFTPSADYTGTDTATIRACLPAPNSTVCDDALLTFNVRGDRSGSSTSPVPTLSEWTLIGLSALLALFGVSRTRRRST